MEVLRRLAKCSMNTDSYMRLPASPLSFNSNNISISGSSVIDGQSAHNSYSLVVREVLVLYRVYNTAATVNDPAPAAILEFTFLSCDQTSITQVSDFAKNDDTGTTELAQLRFNGNPHNLLFPK
ncbi:hypothetical protein Tco_0470965 [Tanacetum coccineum]